MGRGPRSGAGRKARDGHAGAPARARAETMRQRAAGAHRTAQAVAVPPAARALEVLAALIAAGGHPVRPVAEVAMAAAVRLVAPKPLVAVALLVAVLRPVTNAGERSAGVANVPPEPEADPGPGPPPAPGPAAPG